MTSTLQEEISKPGKNGISMGNTVIKYCYEQGILSKILERYIEAICLIIIGKRIKRDFG